MYSKTQEELLDYVAKQTKSFCKDKVDEFSADVISRRLNISRNLASQYLNEFTKEGKLIKANLRPVYFFHRETLEKVFDLTISTVSYASVSEMLNAFDAEKKKLRNFQKAIGSRKSLSDCIEQCKAAAKYPPNGLPILLMGQNGVGKKFLARLMYEYALDEGIIDSTGNFIMLNCSEYSGTNDAIGAIFGWDFEDDHGKSIPGLIETAKDGILLLDEADCLSGECLEKIFQYTQKGEYTSIGGKTAKTARTKLVFTTFREANSPSVKALLRYIPVTSVIPSLEERTPEEKKEMILTFFKDEAKKMDRRIYISSSVFGRLMGYVFTGNIEQLKNGVKHCCANAFLYSNPNEKQLHIYLYHLPQQIIAAKIESPSDEESKNLISIDEFDNRKSSDVITDFYDSVLSCFTEYQGEADSANNLFQKCYAYINNYCDYLFYNKRHVNDKFTAIYKVVSDVCEAVSEKYSVLLPINCGFIIAFGIHSNIQMNSAFHKWEDEWRSELDNALDLLKNTSGKEATIALEISETIHQNIDMGLSKMDMIILILNIKYCNKDIGINSIMGIILCHGYSTASSIADATNKLIGRQTFEAIDMPLNTKVGDIVMKLQKFIQRRIANKNIILLIDMGSLEDINECLRGISNINIGLANNVSTKLALDVGFKIWQGNDMETILKSSCENSKSSYKIMANQKKQEAILFVSDTGIGVAERMSELFLESLPKAIDADIISYDYYRLIQNGKENQVFSRYDVQLILGPVNPNIEHIPFLSIGDIIATKGLAQIKKILSRYLSQEELEAFNQNFIKNFSLLNVVKHLTILNPETLIGYIQEAVGRLQQITGRKFSSKTTVGLYIHISGLIERLITKTPIESHNDLEQFEAENDKFIKQLREAFRVISNHYAVEIPVCEIAYIYDFIEFKQD